MPFTIVPHWYQAFQQKKFVGIFFLVVIMAFGSLYISGQWLCYNETRAGVVLKDPILDLFSPINLSIPLAIFTNTAVVIGLISSMLWPLSMIRTMVCIMLIVYFRIIAMYLIPLDPPADIIPLRDVFLESVFYNGQVLMKDLFFSGHVSNLVLLCLLTPFRTIRIYIGVTTLIVAPMLLLQHVHYSIDVFVAPLFSIVVFILSNTLLKSVEASFDLKHLKSNPLIGAKIRL